MVCCVYRMLLETSVSECRLLAFRSSLRYILKRSYEHALRPGVTESDTRLFFFFVESVPQTGRLYAQVIGLVLVNWWLDNPQHVRSLGSGLARADNVQIKSCGKKLRFSLGIESQPVYVYRPGHRVTAP